MRKPRIASIITGLGAGGAEVYLRMLHLAYPPSKYDYFVYYLRCDRDVQVQQLCEANVTVKCLGCSARYDLRLFYRIYDALYNDKIDLLHGHLPVVSIYSRIVAKWMRIPFIYTEHNEWEAYHPITRLANRATYFLNSAVIAVSDGVKKSIKSNHNAISVIPNAIDTESLHKDLKSLDKTVAIDYLSLPHYAFVFGNVGNFTYKKNQQLLIEAFALYLKSTKNNTAYLVIVGQFFNRENEIIDLVKRLGIQSRIRLVQDRTDAINFIQFFDALVISSRQEGLPISMLEAMSLKIPVISTRVGGIPKVVRDNIDGILVDSNINSISSAMQRLEEEPELTKDMGYSAFVRVKSNFSIVSAVQEINIMYDTFLPRN